MKRKIVISIMFNIRGISVEETKEWINYRLKIFMNYTLESLQNQTNQEFITFIRYKQSTENLVMDALKEYTLLPENIQFVRNNECNEKLAEEIKNYEELFLVRIDSDDMYHKEFIQQLHDYKPKSSTEALINRTGFIYDTVNELLGNYYDPSPPFYTLIYNTKKYLNGKRYKLPMGHTAVKKLKHEVLDGKNYMVVVHEKNKRSTFDKRQRKKIIKDKTEMKRILNNFLKNSLS